MDLANLLSNITPLEVDYLGHKFNMNIFTEKLTPTYKAELIKSVLENAEAGRKDADAQMLADLIHSWETKLNGEPFSPTYENILRLSYPCIRRLITAITDHLGDLANPPSARS